MRACAKLIASPTGDHADANYWFCRWSLMLMLMLIIDADHWCWCWCWFFVPMMIIDADADHWCWCSLFSDADHLHSLIHSMDWSLLHRVDRRQRLAADFSYSMTWRCIHDDTIIDGHSLTRAIVLSRLYHSHFVIEAGRTTRLCCSSEDSTPLTNESPSPHQFICSLFTLTFVVVVVVVAAVLLVEQVWLSHHRMIRNRDGDFLLHLLVLL